MNHQAIAERVAKRTDLLPELVEGLRADPAKIKYGCLKVLRLISEKEPAVLYPEFDRFVQLLDSESNILQWGAIIIIGNLAALDSANKIEPILGRYLQPISGPVMITAANTLGGAAKMARAKPHLADRIARAFLRVETAEYRTSECRNVALGQAVESLDLFFEHIRDSQPIIAFVERQLRNRRNATQRKATAFLKKRRLMAQPSGSVIGSQPIRSATKRMSSAGGSRR